MSAFVRFLTFPKISRKNRLKSMLCLFCVRSAFFWFLILGRGKPFKIKGLQVFGRWRGYNSQNFENGGRGNINQPAREVCSAKKCSVKKGGVKIAKAKREMWQYYYIYILYLYLYLLSHLCELLHSLTVYIISLCNSLQPIFELFSESNR